MVTAVRTNRRRRVFRTLLDRPVKSERELVSSMRDDSGSFATDFREFEEKGYED